MKKIRIFLFIAASLAFATHVYSAEPPVRSGESLLYKIRYGFIVGGNVSFNTNEAYLDGKLFYHNVVDAQTTGFIDQLYKLHDIFESYFDIETGLPRLAIRNISEGKYRFYDEVTYFHNDRHAYSQRMDTIVPLETETFDILSAIYYLRNMDWEKFQNDEVVEITTLFDDKPFPMYIVYKGKETISIKNTKYNCHKFTPVIDPGKIFQKKENMLIWFSDDKNKIPVAIRFNLLVGAFRLELDEYENLAHPFDSKIEKQ